MTEVTYEHIKQWLESPEAELEDGTKLSFDMSAWSDKTDCGTTCCAWGGAYFLATRELTINGPYEPWDIGPRTTLLKRFFLMTNLTINEARLIFNSIPRDGSKFNLTGANLTGADLTFANLRDADLRGARLTDANLTFADLRGADLRGADLRGARLTFANLRDADLRGARLTDADLRGARLIGANLTGANLIGADLEDANLTGALGLQTKTDEPS